MRLLIVEDERKIANALKRGLEQEAFAVDVAYDGDDGLAFATTEAYDAVVLDRMLPGSVDGIEILTKMRAEQITTPVLLLTAKDTVRDRVEGLNHGADDYLVKPFAFEELLARLRALLRRPTQAMDTVLTYEDLSLDPQTYGVKRGQTSIELTQKEFALLEYFMRNPGRVLSKQHLIDRVWDYDADILPNTVEVFVGYLREKIDKPFKGPHLINTRRGFGYIFGAKA